MTNRSILRIAAVAGLTAVALGAFGAHGLKEILQRHATAAIWDTAVFYHMAHALALLFLAQREPAHRGPALCFLSGILIFSGSLYALALSNIRILGAITPLGGLCFLAGWLWLLIAPEKIRHP